MKHFLTLVIWLVSSLAMAQFPSLPYNPDENGDGLIGVVDLQSLLANYGSEFENAIVSENGESAVMYVGNMTRLQCEYACENLPGFWTLPKVFELTPVLGEMPQPVTWLHTDWTVPMQNGTGNKQVEFFEAPGLIKQTASLGNYYNCYCAAKQSPRVEYFTCKASCSDGYAALDACVNEKLAEGWYPLQSQRQQQVYNDCFWQPLWRWAE